MTLKDGRKAIEVPGLRNFVPCDQACTPLKLSINNFHRAHNPEIHIPTSVPLTSPSLEIFQDPPGQGPVQPALGDPASAGELD